MEQNISTWNCIGSASSITVGLVEQHHAAVSAYAQGFF
jgi:hypothetical protein